ncbi:DUF6549 family protein [uncultured Flavobacterium sp.]|uniref:DUF6549 family protein n=1 Tax=uncultured Flavobacterium sp. TaxID=165435 RepID=UPI0025FA9535|nr:DUF6549 family protein [uncultured Flavobacterium sp.]
MKKNIYLIIISALVLMLVISVRQCRQNSNLTHQNLTTITDTVQYYKNTLGQQSASIGTLQMDIAQMRGVIIKKDNELSVLSKEFIKVKSAVKLKTITTFDTIAIVYKDTLPCVFEVKGNVSDNWYSFNYSSDNSGIKLDSFKTWTSVNIATGIKRKWFMGKEAVTTDILLSNPHVRVVEARSAELAIAAPWYRKWYVWALIGMAGGFALAK